MHFRLFYTVLKKRDRDNNIEKERLLRCKKMIWSGKYTKIHKKRPLFLFLHSFSPNIYFLGQSPFQTWHSCVCVFVCVYKLSCPLLWNLSFVFAWFVFKFFMAPSSGLTFNRHRAGNDEAWLSPRCCWEDVSLS